MSGREPPALDCAGWARLRAGHLQGERFSRQQRGHRRPRGLGQSIPSCASLCPRHGAFAPRRPAGPPRLCGAWGPPPGQGGSSAAGGVLAPAPAVPAAASASSLAPSAACNCTAAQRSSSAGRGVSTALHTRQSWPRPRAVWHVSRCAGEPRGIPKWGREPPGGGSRGTAAAEEQKSPRGSELPSEGKARRRHPSDWLRWRCPSGRRRGGQPAVPRARRLAPLPAARGEPRGRGRRAGAADEGVAGIARPWEKRARSSPLRSLCA